MGEKESVALPSELLPHVYTFLLQCDFHKAAKALQKASGEVSRSEVQSSMFTVHCTILKPLTTLSDSEPGLLHFYSYYHQR